jgi:hypothetical protein
VALTTFGLVFQLLTIGSPLLCYFSAIARIYRGAEWRLAACPALSADLDGAVLVKLRDIVPAAFPTEF